MKTTSKLILSFGIAFLVGAENSVCQDSDAEAATGVTVSANFPDGSNISVQNVPVLSPCYTNTRLAMLNANSLNSSFTFNTSYYYPYGDYVVEINGWTGGAGKYWSFTINGTTAPCGIDTQMLSPGDVVVWSLISSTDEEHNPESMQSKVTELRKEKTAQ